MRKTHLTITCAVLAVSLTAAAGSALAQRGGGGGAAAGAAGAARSTSGDLDRLQTRDRTYDQDRLHDQDRLRDKDQTGDRDLLRDRDRLRVDQTAADQISAWSLLTDQERTQFHQQMQQAQTEQARAEIRAKYRDLVQQRARELGISAPFGPGGGQNAVFGSQLLTAQERLQFQQQMQAATSEQQREQIRSQHQLLIRTRAQEMGIDLPPGFGQGPGQQQGQ